MRKVIVQGATQVATTVGTVRKVIPLLKVILMLKIKSVKAQLEYPANFVTAIATISLIGFLGIPALLILTSAFPSIGGWNFYELGFLMALVQMAQGVHHGLFFSFYDHRVLVHRGEFDRLLVRPVHPIWQIMASSLNLSSIGEFLPGLVLFAITCPKARVEWNLLYISLVAIIVLSGAIIEWAVYLFFAAFDFWLEGEAGLLYIPTAFLDSTVRYPIHIYGRAMAFLLTFVFPYAFVAYYPTRYFFHLEGGTLAYLTPVVAAITSAVALGFWSIGVRHYRSTGA